MFSEIGLGKSVDDFEIYLFRNSLGLSWGLLFAVIYFMRVEIVCLEFGMVIYCF